MSSPAAMTTTSYTILGLLAVKPWTTHELVQQVDRSMRRMWPVLRASCTRSRRSSSPTDTPKPPTTPSVGAVAPDTRSPPPAGARWRVGCSYRATAGPRVRAAVEDQLRRQRDEGRHRHRPGRGTRPGSSTRTRRISPPPGLSRRPGPVPGASRLEPAGRPVPYRLLRHGRAVGGVGKRCCAGLARRCRLAPLDRRLSRRLCDWQRASTQP